MYMQKGREAEMVQIVLVISQAVFHKREGEGKGGEKSRVKRSPPLHSNLEVTKFEEFYIEFTSSPLLYPSKFNLLEQVNRVQSDPVTPPLPLSGADP